MEDTRQTVWLLKEGDTMAVRTTWTDVDSFLKHFCEALAMVVEAEIYAHDWDFQFQHWIPQAFEIASHLKGYKADVRVQHVVEAGYTNPLSTDIVSEARNKALQVEPIESSTPKRTA